MRYTPHRFIFLGDFVDRGKWGPECVCYLIALKLLAPSDVYLIRGNHEDPGINCVHHMGRDSFEWQCKDLWGESRGSALWNKFNDFFSTMPLAAVLDDKIFCCHGGIPRYSGGVDDRLDILRRSRSCLKQVCPPYDEYPSYYTSHERYHTGPVPLRKDESPENIAMLYAHDLMWADPTDNLTIVDEWGFGQSGRGTAYGQQAVCQFLENNGLDLIIRGHEAREQGLQVSKQACVLTVFTSSDYCGYGTPGGVVLVRRSHNGEDLICRLILRERPDWQPSAY